MPLLVLTALFLIGLGMLVAGYVWGASRTGRRERVLRDTIDEQRRKLAHVEHEALQRSNLDPITELPVQQSLQEFLEREWRRQVREQQPLSLLIVEVDHFRALNDRSGKPHGDACLKSVAQCLKQAVHRPADFLGRYGAGRFGIVLGGADSNGAMTLAENLRKLVEGLKLPNPASTSGPIITVSIGVTAVTPQRNADWQDIELIAAAERGLTHAKEAGRNRIALEPVAFQPHASL